MYQNFSLKQFNSIRTSVEFAFTHGVITTEAYEELKIPFDLPKGTIDPPEPIQAELEHI